MSHNANVVVLADAELICVRGRGERDRAKVRVRGSIDHPMFGVRWSALWKAVPLRSSGAVRCTASPRWP